MLKKPSVTTAIHVTRNPDYETIPPSILEKACANGKIFHKACYDYALAGIMYKGPDEKINADFAALTRFMNDNIKTVVFAEKLFSNKLYGYHGHPDLGVIYNGSSELVLIDYKRTAKRYPQHDWQLAAYSHLDGVETRRNLIWTPAKNKQGYRCIELTKRKENFNFFLLCGKMTTMAKNKFMVCIFP